MYKYVISSVETEISIFIPIGADSFSFGILDGKAIFHCRVNLKNKPVETLFWIAPLGQPIPDKFKIYIGTTKYGPFMWHLFMTPIGETKCKI